MNPAVEKPGGPAVARRARRILFASAHSIVDFSNGASIATLDMLEGLTTAGFACQAFCAAKLDFQKEASLDEIVDAMHEPHHDQPSVCDSQRASVMYTRRRRVQVTIIRLDSTRHVNHRPEEVESVLAFFRKFLDVYRPDVMLAYGGDPITMGMIAEAQPRSDPRGIRLAQLRVHKRPGIRPRRLLPRRLGVCPPALSRTGRARLPSPVVPCRLGSGPGHQPRAAVCHVRESMPRERGLSVCPHGTRAGPARPDIPLLVVESRGTKESLGACGLDLEAAGNIRVMAHTTDPHSSGRSPRSPSCPRSGGRISRSS